MSTYIYIYLYIYIYIHICMFIYIYISQITIVPSMFQYQVMVITGWCKGVHGHHAFPSCARLGSQAGCWQQLFVAIETVDIPMKHGYFNHVFCGMFTGGSPWQLWMIFVVRFFESFGWVAFLKKIDPFRTMACDHRWSKSTGRGSTQAGSGGACSLSSTAFLCTCLSTFAN